MFFSSYEYSIWKFLQFSIHIDYINLDTYEEKKMKKIFCVCVWRGKRERERERERGDIL